MAMSERLDFLKSEEPASDRRTRRETWPVNNSGLDNYFAVDLPGHPEGVLGIIEEQLGMAEGNAGIDIAGGSNGVALRKLLSMGILEKALVTNYRDKRNLAARLTPGLKHARGDIVRPRTWERIINWQERVAPEGLALVMHRPDGSMQDFSPDFYEGAAHLLLDMIRPEGIMFTQMPFSLRNRYASSLEPICQGIEDRPDVRLVIASKVPKGPQDVRRRENCVVIVKG